MNAATLDANQRHIRADVIALGDFMGDALQGAFNGRSVQDEDGFRHKKSDPARNANLFAPPKKSVCSWLPWQPRRAALKEMNVHSIRFGGQSSAGFSATGRDD